MPMIEGGPAKVRNDVPVADNVQRSATSDKNGDFAMGAADGRRVPVDRIQSASQRFGKKPRRSRNAGNFCVS